MLKWASHVFGVEASAAPSGRKVRCAVDNRLEGLLKDRVYIQDAAFTENLLS